VANQGHNNHKLNTTKYTSIIYIDASCFVKH